ncbi:MAG: hypothetical protein R3C97_01245 [Geminicoccaceae bacterium]
MPRARGRQAHADVPDLSLRARGRQNPRIDTFEIDLDDCCRPMVLDALIKIKGETDSSLTFPPLLPRRHLRFVRDEHRRT